MVFTFHGFGLIKFKDINIVCLLYMHFDRYRYITTTTQKKNNKFHVDIKYKQRKNCYKSYLNSARAKKKPKNDDHKNLFSHYTHTHIHNVVW